MKAILLCAGYATRLYPLTKDCPKHLLEVGGKSILSHVVDRIACLPLDEMYIVTNDKFCSHFEKWRNDAYDLPVPIKVLNDGTLSNDDRLGSIGDVDFAIQTEKIDDDLLIVNADNLFTFDIKLIYARFNDKKNLIACYDVKSNDEARKMGIPTTDSNGRITSFVEKPENPFSTEVAIGIYFYSKAAVRMIRDYVSELAKRNLKADTTGDFVEWISSKLPVYTHTFDSENDVWIDIGTPETYEDARRCGLF